MTFTMHLDNTDVRVTGFKLFNVLGLFFFGTAMISPIFHVVGMVKVLYKSWKIWIIIYKRLILHALSGPLLLLELSEFTIPSMLNIGESSGDIIFLLLDLICAST